MCVCDLSPRCGHGVPSLVPSFEAIGSPDDVTQLPKRLALTAAEVHHRPFIGERREESRGVHVHAIEQKA